MSVGNLAQGLLYYWVENKSEEESRIAGALPIIVRRVSRNAL